MPSVILSHLKMALELLTSDQVSPFPIFYDHWFDSITPAYQETMRSTLLGNDQHDIFSCQYSTTDGVFDKLSQYLQARENEGFDLRIWVGFCANTTNSVMGCCQNSSTLITSKYFWVVIVKCLWHVSNLCAHYSSKKLVND